jgi:hypothetical protein
MNNQTTQCYKVLPKRWEHESKTYKRDEVIRYHSHGAEWIDDNWPKTKPIDDETLKNYINIEWLKPIDYQDWWS